MGITVYPSRLCGRITPPASKSHTHRALILSALSCGTTRIYNPSDCLDVSVTAACLENAGASVSRGDGFTDVTGTEKFLAAGPFECVESGSTLRFLVPVISCLSDFAEFRVSGSLSSRPISQLAAVLNEAGVKVSVNSGVITTEGLFHPGNYSVHNPVSSQYISGLLMAFAASSGGSSVRISGRMESYDYVTATEELLRIFGVECKEKDGVFSVPEGSKPVSPKEITIPSDYSSAAFFMVGAALCGEMTFRILPSSFTCPDSSVVRILADMGADITSDGDLITVKKSPLNGIDTDASSVPDLVPVLSVAASFAQGETIIRNVSRLHFKESDRVLSTVNMINSLGGNARCEDNAIIISHCPLKGGKIHSFGDHRIAMASSIAACACREEVYIDNSECVGKSYPAFFDDLISSGGKCRYE